MKKQAKTHLDTEEKFQIKYSVLNWNTHTHTPQFAPLYTDNLGTLASLKYILITFFQGREELRNVDLTP